MPNNSMNLYLSKSEILAFLIIIPPMVFFWFFAFKAYEGNVPVAIISGIGALILSIAFISQVRFTYFILTNRPAFILTDKFLIDNLTNKQFTWVEIDKMEHSQDEGIRPRVFILITSKSSDESIKIRSRLVNSDTNKSLRREGILELLIKFHKKYGNKN